MLKLLKQWKLTLSAAALLVALHGAMIGCSQLGIPNTPSERVTELNAMIDSYQAQADSQDATIEVLADTLSGLREQLTAAQATDDDGLIAKVTAAIAETEELLAKARELKDKADEVVAGINEKIDALLAGGEEITLADEIEAYIPAAREGAKYLPPPWNMIVDGGLVGLAGLLERRRRKTNTALTEVVDGVNRVIKSKPVEEQAKIKATLGNRQTIATEAEVKRVKAKNGI